MTESNKFKKKSISGETYRRQNWGSLRTLRTGMLAGVRSTGKQKAAKSVGSTGASSLLPSLSYLPASALRARAWHSEESDLQSVACCSAEWKESVVWMTNSSCCIHRTKRLSGSFLRYWCLCFIDKEAECITWCPTARMQSPGLSAPATVLGWGCTSVSSQWPLHGRAVGSEQGGG